METISPIYREILNIMDNKKKTNLKVKKSKVKESVIIDIEDVYRIVNKVQVSKKEATFSVLAELYLVVKNILNDAGLEFKSKENKTKTKTLFVIFPTWVESEDDDLALEFFEDEILEDDQLFG